MGVSLSARVVLGSAVWIALLGGAAALLASPGVRAPLARTARTFAEDALGAPEREEAYEVPDTRGVTLGLPVFRDGGEGGERPIGHVVGVGERSVRVRFEPGAERRAGLALVSLAPSRTLAEALSLAVPPETAARLAATVRARLEATAAEVLLPGAEARLPAFWKRVDPAADPATRALFEDLGRDLLKRLGPQSESLGAEIASSLKARFDFLARVGLLWKVLRGDAEGLQREVTPVVREAAARWWEQHAGEVLAVVGEGVHARRADLEAWLRGTVWAAARDELLLPVLADQRARLEAEAEALLRQAVDDVALAPGGGFRPRFASVLRTHLLGRGEALLLLAPKDGR